MDAPLANVSVAALLFILPSLQLKVDHVLVAVGIRPDVSLASSAGLEVDPQLGGFRVNSELQACTDVWVVSVTVYVCMCVCVCVHVCMNADIIRTCRNMYMCGTIPCLYLLLLLC